jgi:hypothetical protein
MWRIRDKVRARDLGLVRVLLNELDDEKMVPCNAETLGSALSQWGAMIKKPWRICQGCGEKFLPCATSAEFCTDWCRRMSRWISTAFTDGESKRDLTLINDLSPRWLKTYNSEPDLSAEKKCQLEEAKKRIKHKVQTRLQEMDVPDAAWQEAFQSDSWLRREIAWEVEVGRLQ